MDWREDLSGTVQRVVRWSAPQGYATGMASGNGLHQNLFHEYVAYIVAAVTEDTAMLIHKAMDSLQADLQAPLAFGSPTMTQFSVPIVICRFRQGEL